MEEYLETCERLKGVFEKDIVFIVGATRWGTAWVQQCLDAHPEILCKGEGHFTDNLFPMLARVFDDYNGQAEKVGNRLRKAGLPGNASGFTFDDVHHVMTTAVGLVFDRWTGGGAGDGIKVIAEKTPEHVVSLELLARVVPKLKIVHVYRDGRDEAVSAWDFNSKLSRGAFRRKFPVFGDFARDFADGWGRGIGAARRFERANKGKCFHLRSEDLIEGTAGAVGRLFAFLGAGAQPGVVKACSEAAWEASPLDIDPGAWKTMFDAEAARAFTHQYGELLKLLGYEEE